MEGAGISEPGDFSALMVELGVVRFESNVLGETRL